MLLTHVLIRRWYVVLIGIAVTVAATKWSTPEVVYWAEVTVTVVQPSQPREPKTLENVSSDPVAAATMLVEMVNRGHPTMRSVSPDATLYGEGKRETVQAALRDEGGQWASRVQEPIIQVQAVSHDPNRVRSQLSEQTGAVRGYLEELQDTLAVASPQRLTLTVEPEDAAVGAVTGSGSRAMGVTLIVGLGLTLIFTYWFELCMKKLRQREDDR